MIRAHHKYSLHKFNFNLKENATYEVIDVYHKLQVVGMHYKERNSKISREYIYTYILTEKTKHHTRDSSVFIQP